MAKSLTKPHKIKVTRRLDSVTNFMTGGNTIVELDGVPLKCCSALKFTVKAGSVAKVTLDLFADVEIDGQVLASIKKVRRGSPRE